MAKCESCDKRADGKDPVGVPLCQSCYDLMCDELGYKRRTLNQGKSQHSPVQSAETEKG